MFDKNVFKTWTLILQLGITMLVPIFLLIALAYFIRQKFAIDFMLFAVIIGVAVGIRNVYVVIRAYLKSMDGKKGGESELMKKHRKNLEKGI